VELRNIALEKVRTVGGKPKRLSPEDRSILLSFASPKLLAENFRILGFTHAEEIEILVDIARNSPKDNARLQALRALKNIWERTMELSGLIQRVEDRANFHGPDGTRTLSRTRIHDILEEEAGDVPSVSETATMEPQTLEPIDTLSEVDDDDDEPGLEE